MEKREKYESRLLASQFRGQIDDETIEHAVVPKTNQAKVR
jgi:hypothetical protein